MSDFVCNKCGGAAPAVTQMAVQPVQNAYWDRVRAVTCSGCWTEWKDMEVKIINEYRLNMLERDHRAQLKKYMHDFLNLDGTSTVAGQNPQGIPKE